MSAPFSNVESEFAVVGQAVHSNGYSCFPIPPHSKRTHWRGWTRWCGQKPTDAQLAGWMTEYPYHGVAIACGASTVAIDIDETDKARADELQDIAFRLLGSTPLVRIGRAPRRVLVYRVSANAPIASTSIGTVEIIGKGRYFVGFGIHPITGKPYTWMDSSPATLTQAALPLVTPTEMSTFCGALRGFIGFQAAPAPPHVGVAENGPATSKVPGWTPRPKTDVRWILDAQGRVVDGRDVYLATRIYLYFAQGLPNADAIAAAAWAVVSATAELERPKRNGKLWSIADAKTKAKALLASGKPRPPRRRRAPHDDEHGFWTTPTKQAFLHIVDAAGADGHLSPATVAVSRAMLGYVQGSGSCYASTGTLAGNLELSLAAVKKARRVLRQSGFWRSYEEIGGRGCMAHYVPNPAALVRGGSTATNGRETIFSPGASSIAAETVDTTCTRINQWGGGDKIPSADAGFEQDRDGKEVSSLKSVLDCKGDASPMCRDNLPLGAASAVGEVPQR